VDVADQFASAPSIETRYRSPWQSATPRGTRPCGRCGVRGPQASRHVPATACQPLKGPRLCAALGVSIMSLLQVMRRGVAW
jgi:hypothetical protein